MTIQCRSLPSTVDPDNRRGRTSRDTANPISRPVYMLVRSFNINPVIDDRSR
jgi:hypothetical protein